jgi:hypothetical protein
MRQGNEAGMVGSDGIHPATVRDLEVVLYHRRRMLEDMGFPDREPWDAMLATAGPLMRPSSTIKRSPTGRPAASAEHGEGSPQNGDLRRLVADVQ